MGLTFVSHHHFLLFLAHCSSGRASIEQLAELAAFRRRFPGSMHSICSSKTPVRSSKVRLFPVSVESAGIPSAGNAVVGFKSFIEL